MPAPLSYHLWVGASRLLLPFFAGREQRKVRAAGLPSARAREKRGFATAPRPKGRLIWFHAASVGESLSVLALIHRMGVLLPDDHFLITSGTPTSAALIEQRIPPRCLHQFAPLDAPAPLRRFLRHWRPDAALFVESEIWPQMLRRTHATGARMAMVNARLSVRSIESWRKKPRLAAYLFDVFDLILTQNAAMAEALIDLGAPADRVKSGVNLKSMADPLPMDQAALEGLRTALEDRPVWVASSTHDGEELAVLKAHAVLLTSYPNACLILAPRHPDRGDTVWQMIKDHGFDATRRGTSDDPTGSVYLADTMGELGLWYALTDVVFLGGSLRPIGGHNPFEVAQSGAAVLSGTHVSNFAETFAAMETAGAARLVSDADDLAAQVGALLGDATQRGRMTKAAHSFAQSQQNMLEAVAKDLITALGLNGS